MEETFCDKSDENVSEVNGLTDSQESKVVDFQRDSSSCPSMKTCNTQDIKDNPVIHNDVMCDNENSSSPTGFTIGSPYTPSPGECSVQSCLSQFCSPEVLEGKNKFACEECSKRSHGGSDEQEDGQQGSSSGINSNLKYMSPFMRSLNVA